MTQHAALTVAMWLMTLGVASVMVWVIVGSKRR